MDTTATITGVTVGRYVLLYCKLCGPVAVHTGTPEDAAATHLRHAHPNHTKEH